MSRSQEIRRALEASHDADPEVRRLAVRELCPCEVKRVDLEVWERVFEMTRDPDVRVRRNALHGLIDGSPASLEERVVATLQAMRNDPEAKLRRNVRRVLAHYHRTGEINVG